MFLSPTTGFFSLRMAWCVTRDRVVHLVVVLVGELVHRLEADFADVLRSSNER